MIFSTLAIASTIYGVGATNVFDQRKESVTKVKNSMQSFSKATKSEAQELKTAVAVDGGDSEYYVIRTYGEDWCGGNPTHTMAMKTGVCMHSEGEGWYKYECHGDMLKYMSYGAVENCDGDVDIVEYWDASNTCASTVEGEFRRVLSGHGGDHDENAIEKIMSGGKSVSRTCEAEFHWKDMPGFHITTNPGASCGDVEPSMVHVMSPGCHGTDDFEEFVDVVCQSNAAHLDIYWWACGDSHRGADVYDTACHSFDGASTQYNCIDGASNPLDYYSKTFPFNEFGHVDVMDVTSFKQDKSKGMLGAAKCRVLEEDMHMGSLTQTRGLVSGTYVGGHVQAVYDIALAYAGSVMHNTMVRVVLGHGPHDMVVFEHTQPMMQISEFIVVEGDHMDDPYVSGDHHSKPTRGKLMIDIPTAGLDHGYDIPVRDDYFLEVQIYMEGEGYIHVEDCTRLNHVHIMEDHHMD